MRAAIAALAVGALALVSGVCSSPVRGTASFGASTEIGGPAQSDVPSIAPAPKVAEPLKPDAFVSDACRALSADMAAALNLATPGIGDRTPTSSGCIWRTKDRRFTIGVSYLTTLTAGLSEIYAQREKNPDAYLYFEPTIVLGYPALYADKIDDRARGHCLLNIGVTDSLFAQIAVNHVPRSQNVCELAARAGEAVITTMKEGA